MLWSGKGNAASGKGELGLYKKAISLFLHYSWRRRILALKMNWKYKKGLFCNGEGAPLSWNTKVIVFGHRLSKMETTENLQWHTREFMAVRPESSTFHLEPLFVGWTGFLRVNMIYSSSLLKASSPGLGKGKINESQWPCCRLLSASCQFFFPWEGFEMRLFSTDCPW